MKFSTISLIAAAQAVRHWDNLPHLDNPTPWDKDSLQPCPEDETRNILDDGYNRVVKWPFVGATCALQVTDDVTLVMLGDGPAAELGGAKPAPKKAAKKPAAPEVPIGKPNLDHLEHCPDFNERYTLVNGRTLAVPYPKEGFNCNPAWSLVQGQKPFGQNIDTGAAAPKYPAGLEHCPDRPERQTLRDGVTKPIAFPAKGANCTPDVYPAQAGFPYPYALNQKNTPWGQNIDTGAAAPAYPAGLEHCPDRPERQTLRDGVTKPIAFPAEGANCKADVYPPVAGVPFPYALSQKNTPWGQNIDTGAAATAYPAGLEHCPDRPERQTLRDGVTKPVPFPAKGANCKSDIYPGKEGAPAPYH
jgi:hypothetical protein